MQPGRELDALIAEKVMGLPVKKHPFSDHLVVWYGDREMHCIEDYSTDITAAWEVVEKLNAPGFQVRRVNYGPGQTWMAGVDGQWFDYADTAPHAICLAALKAVGNE